MTLIPLYATPIYTMSHITILLVSLFCEQKLIEQMRESDFCEGKAQYKYQPPVPVNFSNPVSPPSEAESCTLLSLNIVAMFSVYVLYCIVLYCIVLYCIVLLLYCCTCHVCTNLERYSVFLYKCGVTVNTYNY